MKLLRGPWLLLGGLVLGLALGLFYARVLSPVSYADTNPLALRPQAKDAYRLMIAAAYGADGDLGRARARLALVDEGDPARALAAQAQQLVASGGSSQDARRLALLAASLGKLPGAETSAPTVRPSASAAAPSQTAPVSTATPSLTPANPLALTPFPTPSLTPTLRAPFVLERATPVCDPSLGAPLIQVQARDFFLAGVPGVPVQVTWSGGQDTFYTGLKPQQGSGYADFTMTPGVTYTVRLGDAGAPVENLTAAACPAPTGGVNPQAYPGGVLLEFIQR
jgi:hypothetical protein